MVNMIRVAFVVLVVLAQGCVVFPVHKPTEPKISGIVRGIEGAPIEGAVIERLRYVSGPAYFPTEWQEVAITDAEGRFTASTDYRWDWLHHPWTMRHVHCDPAFRIMHQSYITYEPEMRDPLYHRFDPHGNACRGVELEVNIQLKNDD